MSNKIKIGLILFSLVTVCYSCKDDDAPMVITPAPCSAGLGGNVTIVSFAKHNGIYIINSSTNQDTAYIKFNATTSPGLAPADYDTFYVSEEGEDHIHCGDLKCGDYFLYRTAFDTTTMMRYSGTQVVNLTQTSGEKDVATDVN